MIKKQMCIMIGTFLAIAICIGIFLGVSITPESAAGEISGQISVCIDGKIADMSLVSLQCIKEAGYEWYDIDRSNRKQAAKYSITTNDKGYYEVILKVPNHLIGDVPWENKSVEYKIFIFNLAGDNDVKADIHIDIGKEDGVYTSCCTVTAVASGEEIVEVESVLNEQQSVEVRTGP